MNFTRDPIIETVITPREGCKLVVRSSKGSTQEDYLVDALEVVSFGHSFFFRSIERPKSFLVPVSDYEIFESKEPRMALKNASAERSIKIGGGREAPPARASSHEAEEGHFDHRPAGREGGNKGGGNKRRRGRRGGRDRHDSYSPAEHEATPREETSQESSFEEASAKPHGGEEAPREKAPSFISKLFPPPPTLIKETLSRYKPVDPAEEDLLLPKEPMSFEENSSMEDPYDEPPKRPLNPDEME